MYVYGNGAFRLAKEGREDLGLIVILLFAMYIVCKVFHCGSPFRVKSNVLLFFHRKWGPSKLRPIVNVIFKSHTSNSGEILSIVTISPGPRYKKRKKIAGAKYSFKGKIIGFPNHSQKDGRHCFKLVLLIYFSGSSHF